MARLLEFEEYLRLRRIRPTPRVAGWDSLELVRDPGPAPKPSDLHPFVFHPDAIGAAEDGAHDTASVSDFDFLLDLPFERVWIETYDQSAIHTSMGFLPGHRSFDAGHVGFFAWGMTIEEIAPGDYMLEMLGQMECEEGEVEHPLFRLEQGNATPTMLWRHRLTMGAGDAHHRFDDWMLFAKLQQVFRFARGAGALVGTTKARPIAIGKGMRKRFVKVKDLVHVVLKEHRLEYERQAGLANKVDWSHKWQVRGHWRKVSGIGKDRTGAYRVKGATWVQPHVKGAGPLVEKTRFVRRGSSGEPDGTGAD